MIRLGRRRFLQLGSGLLALPLLESDGNAQDSAPVYSFFCRQANGVTQGDSNGEEDRFWPAETGIITPQSLAIQTDRVISELSMYADSLITCKGLSYGFSGNGCGHSGGGNQCLTAAAVSEEPSGNESLGMGESIDNRIARHFANNGGEPLTLYTGPRNGYIEEVLSYRGPMDLRAAEDDPWIAYQRMLGFSGGGLDALVIQRNQSINDLVLDQLNALLNRSDLSASDQRRLEQHFDSVRDFERLASALSADEEQAMASISGLGTLNDNRIIVARMHMDLVALAFSCGYASAATLQIGDGNDGTEYTIGGQRLPSFHWISHRIYSDGAEGDSIEGAEDMHHEIDRLFAQTFGYFLSRLEDYGILDSCISVWCNDLGNGVSHSYNNVPYIIAGSGNGALRTGQHLDFDNVTNNRLFNTLLAAAGVSNEDGTPVEDFGDASLEGGLLTELLT